MTRSLRYELTRLALGAAITLAATEALADMDADRRAQASSFFDAGAQAYDAGQYLVAAEAFAKAYELVPSAALLFSAAQAHRRDYLAASSPESLRQAIKLYRDYLELDREPRRREDAMKALESLVPLEARLAEAHEVQKPAGAERATRLLLSARAEGAQVSVDGGPFVSAPVMSKVQPGMRRVIVRAPGHHDEELLVQAVEDELVPRHVTLRPRGAKLSVKGTPGARVLIDGQARASLPLGAAIALDPGAHFVAITLPGHEPFSETIDLGRDESAELMAHLPMTRQRIAAIGLLSLGAAGAVAGGVLGGLTLDRQSTAVSLRDLRETRPLTTAERDRFNEALSERDQLGGAAAITGGVAAILIAAGAGMFVLDDPEVIPPRDEPRDAPRTPGPQTEFEVGLLSLGLRVAF